MYGTSREGSDSFWEVVYTQRAIRRFKPDPVPDEVLLRVLEAATKAPSGSNQQPWRFLVVRDPAKRSLISEAMKAHMQSNEAMRTYFESGATSDDRSRRLMLTGALELANHIDAAPAIILPCLTSGSDRLLSGSSIFPAVQNLLLAARALGLGTVLTTFNLGIDTTLREVLGIPEAARPVALIPIGYPAGNFGPTSRKPVGEVVGWDAW